MKISVIQPGARLHYAMPRVFADAGLLERLYTDLHADHRWLRMVESVFPARITPNSLRRLFGRRLPSGLPPKLVHDRALQTIAVSVGATLNIGPGQKSVTRSLLRDLEDAPLGEGDVVYTVIVNEDVEVMQRLKDRGVTIVHECILGPDVGLLLLEEHARFPDLGPQPNLVEIERGRERDFMKYSIADLTLVPSSFTERAVRDVAPEDTQIAQVPYGFALDGFSEKSMPEPGLALAVGTVGRRKGHPDLAAAARILAKRNSQVRVRVVGPADESIVTHPLMKGPEYVGQVPRTLVSSEYARADFFVLPTICDSFGIVIVEAMAAGLPVITTPNCGDIVRDGVDGFIVPVRDPKELAARMEELAGDRKLRARMSAAARTRAQQFNQEAYAKRLVAAVRGLGMHDRR